MDPVSPIFRGHREAGSPLSASGLAARWHGRSLARSCAWAGLTIALIGCDGGSPRASRPNVILVSIDTLRADHLGCYGYPRPTSPSIDLFRRDAVLFEEAIAHAPSTLPSHASMLTSQLPQHHRAWHTAGLRLPSSAETLAEVLRDSGYATVAVVGGGQLSVEFGLDQGFATYESYGAARKATRFQTQIKRALELLENQGDRPTFLFLHTYEVHHPYTPDPTDLAALDPDYEGDIGTVISVPLLTEINTRRRLIDEADLAHIVSAYDAEIISMDRAFADFLDGLRKRGRYRDSLIIVTSDHGEEFGEHGTVGWHAHSLYEELLRVPLLIKLPGNRHAGASVSGQVRGIDIAPTILDVIGLDPPPAFAGTSLLPELAAGSVLVDRPAAGLWREAALHEQEPVTDGVRLPPWKLAEGRFHDLSEDPGERDDATDSQPGIRARLQQELDRLLAERPALTPERAHPTAETMEQLRALGYAAGARDGRKR